MADLPSVPVTERELLAEMTAFLRSFWAPTKPVQAQANDLIRRAEKVLRS